MPILQSALDALGMADTTKDAAQAVKNLIGANDAPSPRARRPVGTSAQHACGRGWRTRRICQTRNVRCMRLACRKGLGWRMVTGFMNISAEAPMISTQGAGGNNVC